MKLNKTDLKEKVVLITGASSGIGAATAEAFASAGAKVALAARRKDRLVAIASRLNEALVLETDLGDPEQAVRMVDQTVKHFGRIDILINNAATIIVAPAETVSTQDLEKAFRTNLLSPVAATQAALRFMEQQGRGHIINIGSPGFMMGIPFYSPYVCSKAAFSAWTRTIQAEWSGKGIMISEYFPGYIRTNSRPESRIGDVDQDFLMSKKQNFMTRKFAQPKTADHVARQLIRLAIRPRTIAYSGFGVYAGTFISNIASFRLSIARQMAETAAMKLDQNEKPE
jgi:NAD(P)-dependent dehydrogenase (short-subunit alcohol dehydrogenase family)